MQAEPQPLNGSHVSHHQPSSIRKRDGVTLQPFDSTKLRNAIHAAWVDSVGPVDDKANKVISEVIGTVVRSLPGDVVDVELIQNTVEIALMRLRQYKVAKAYILYRHHRQELRQLHEKAIDPKGLSDYIHASKYARYVPELLRREVYEETVARVEGMHLAQFPDMADELRQAFKLVYDKRVLPSMRSMQFGGPAILRNHNRLYNCLGRETKFITSLGVRSFNDFSDGDEISVRSHSGIWKKAVVRNYGEQELFTVRLKRGGASQFVRATRDHQWVLRDTSRTTTLKEKDQLLQPPRGIGDWVYEERNPEERMYWAMGYVYGDGTLVKDGEGVYKYSMARLCGDDGEFLPRFQELGFEWSRPPSCHGEAIVYTGRYLKTLPSLEVDGLMNVTAFVRGYLDADGHKNPNWYKDGLSEFNGIQSSDPAGISFIREVFPVVGAYVLSERDKTGEETNFGVRGQTSWFNLSLGFGSSGCSAYAVQEIAPCGKESVWCLEVEDDHSFVLANGVVTGNCSATHIDRWGAFSEALFLLLSGCGVGFSVQFDHVERLSPVAYIDPKKVQHHVVQDTIEGWADALKALLYSFQKGTNLELSYHKVRPAGSPLKTSGGRAPGHLKLKESLEQVRSTLLAAQGRKLRPIEAYRIMCFAADAVLSGGIRRSAMICLFSLEDSEMMFAKTGNWWQTDPWFANSNNSVVLKRDDVKKKQFKRIFQMTREWGEPGFFFVSDYDHATNPCCEINLYPVLVVTPELQERLAKQGTAVELGSQHTGWAFCNLTEINASKLGSYEDFVEAAKAATLIGTVQAAYTDMPYLGWVSEEIAKRDALLGIGMTGITDAPQIALNSEYQRRVAEQIRNWNREYAARLAINSAARTTCVKPSGTTSLALGCIGSGIHPHHARRYIRRVTADELEPVFQAFKAVNPKLCQRKPDGKWVIEFPVQAPEGAILKGDQTAIQFLDMVRSTQVNWVVPGTDTSHPGFNGGHHNVSNTVTVQPDEWDTVANYVWTHRDDFTGVSLLPSTGDKNFAFAPLEAVTTEADERRWLELVSCYNSVDYTSILELEDGTALSGEAACAGGMCEVKL